MKLLSEGYKCTKTGIFCRTESVAMTLKIVCTYAHDVTLGSRCKMANNHRVTDLEKFPVRISKDEAPTPWPVVGPLFISSLLFHLSRAPSLSSPSPSSLQIKSIKRRLCGSKRWTIQTECVYIATEFSCSVQDGIYALGKVHMCSSPYLRSFPNITFETVPIFVWLTMALSRPFKDDSLALFKKKRV